MIVGSRDLEIFLLPLGREGYFLLWVEKSRHCEGGLGLGEEISNMIGDRLFFYRGEVKVAAVRKEFLGNVEHQTAEGRGEERREGVLAFWHRDTSVVAEMGRRVEF